jgi:hypothetical protein
VAKSARTECERGEAGAGASLFLALLVLGGTQLMVVLDATIVNVALPAIGGALGPAILSTVARTTETGLAELGRVPTPPDLSVALTEGHSAGLLIGSLFAIAGVVAVALIRVVKSQVEEASLVPSAV